MDLINEFQPQINEFQLQIEEFQLQAEDGIDIFCYRLVPGAARGVVLILHGMAEHSSRYHPFAYQLAEQGYCVYACDHRGHGQTGLSMGKLGYFADADGWMRVIHDILLLLKTIKSQQPDLPVYIFGHSMGSYLTRTLMTLPEADVAGVILSGTSLENRVLLSVVSGLSQLLCHYPGKDKETALLGLLTFGAFNQKFKPVRTPYDWLSADTDNVDRYNADPLCGFPCANAFYRDLFYGLNIVNDFNLLKVTNRKPPLLLLAGLSDPVSHSGKDIPILAEKYKEVGFTDIRHKVYSLSRHEIINDVQKAEVAADIIKWLNQQIDVQLRPLIPDMNLLAPKKRKTISEIS